MQITLTSNLRIWIPMCRGLGMCGYECEWVVNKGHENDIRIINMKFKITGENYIHGPSIVLVGVYLLS